MTKKMVFLNSKREIQQTNTFHVSETGWRHALLPRLQRLGRPSLRTRSLSVVGQPLFAAWDPAANTHPSQPAWQPLAYVNKKLLATAKVTTLMPADRPVNAQFTDPQSPMIRQRETVRTLLFLLIQTDAYSFRVQSRRSLPNPLRHYTPVLKKIPITSQDVIEVHHKIISLLLGLLWIKLWK